MSTARSRPGRPRDPRTGATILDAVRAVLAEAGYAGLSFEAVAARAGVTRPTIYRRWPSRLHLAYEAAFPVTDGSRIIDTGDFAGDLETLVRETVAAYSRPATRAAVPGILAEFQRQPELAGQLRQPHEAQVRHRFSQIVDSAKSRGAVRNDLDPDLVFDTIVGAVQFRLIFHQHLKDRFVDDLANLILTGAAAPVG